jgi:hypothetical protein
MITRFALFEGHIKPHDVEAFRAAILKDVLPHWNSFSGVIAVRFASRMNAMKAHQLCHSS